MMYAMVAVLSFAIGFAIGGYVWPRVLVYHAYFTQDMSH